MCALPLSADIRPSVRPRSPHVWVKPASKAESLGQWFSAAWPRGPLFVVGATAAVMNFFVTFFNEWDKEAEAEGAGLRRKKTQ